MKLNLCINQNNLYGLPECAEMIYERAIDGAVNREEVKDNLWASINDSLIYYDDQWELMRYYFTPAEADLDEAFELLYNDLWKATDDVIEKVECVE